MATNPSTADILAQIRAGGTGSEAPAADAAPPVEEAASPEPVSSDAAPSPAAPAPSGTADILASIKGGGGAPAAPAPSAPAPGGTADILASIKGGGGGAAPAGGAAPKGTADILASIKGGAAPAAAKPAPAAAKAAPVDTAKAAGMSAAEMIAQARKGIVTADPVTGEKKAEAKPVALPAKPLKKPGAAAKPAAKPKKGEVPRRSFIEALLSPIVVAWASMVAATAAASLGVARYMMPNVLVEPPTKFKIGPLTDYGAGTVSTKWKAQFGVWIVNDEIDGQQMIYALSTVCTHLGCTPNWLEGEQKFKCPCHGSGFYRTGVNFEGPAPRPLERHGIRIAEDGMLEVDKSVKFQGELGQWENSASYVPV